MKIIVNSIDNKYLETISFEDLENIKGKFKKFSSMKIPLEAKIFAINESLNSHLLSKIKNNFDNINIYSISIYSNSRHTILAGKSLKIHSTFIKEQKAKNKFVKLN